MNKDLYNKVYTIPQNILNHLQKYSGEEIIDNALDRKSLTYQNMKKIKSKMESGDKEKLGGDLFLNWINQSLGQDRNHLDTSKQTRMDTGMENSFIQPHEKNSPITMNRPSKSHSKPTSDIKIVECLKRINEIISKI